MLNYLFRVAVFLQLPYLYGLKFKRIFGVFVLWSSKYMNLVVQFSMSCAFRCIASRLAAYLLYHFVFLLSRGFSNFFQVFFARFLRNLAFPLASLRLAGCSLAAPIVYHILPRLSSGFSKFFPDFSRFSCGKALFHRNILPPYVIRQVLAYLSHILIHRLFLRRIM